VGAGVPTALHGFRPWENAVQRPATTLGHSIVPQVGWDAGDLTTLHFGGRCLPFPFWLWRRAFARAFFDYPAFGWDWRMCREESPDTAGHGSLCKQGRFAPHREATDSVTEKIPPLDAPPSGSAFRVRVKRWGKSPPRRQQWRRHDKPSRVQGKIGDGVARSFVPGMSHAASCRGPASRGDREMNVAITSG